MNKIISSILLIAFISTQSAWAEPPAQPRHSCMRVQELRETDPESTASMAGEIQEPSTSDFIYASHFTSLQAAELIFKYGFYGGIGESGDAFTIGLDTLTKDSNQTIFGKWINGIEVKREKPILIVFKVPKTMIYPYENGELASFLTDRAKVNEIPKGLLEESERQQIKGIASPYVFLSFETLLERGI